MRCLIIVLSILICGCSASRRANRLVKRAVRLDSNVLQKDTTKIIDTITIEKFDTNVVNLLSHNDTVTVVNNEKVIVKYYYNTSTKEIQHDVKTPADTIIKERIIIKTTHREVVKWYDWSNPWIYLIALSIFLFIRRDFKD